jgi:NAD-dependent deacetylase
VESAALVRRWLNAAESVAALTGAGISAESGIPTFRGPDGLWRRYRAEDLATPQAFERDPKLVWEWYEWRRGLIAAAQPNGGHRALAALARRKKFTLISQNVDSLHERAGSRDVLKLHGDILVQRCVACGREHRHEEPQPDLPPRCRCGGLERPGVVWFGESLLENVLARAIAAAQAAELFLVIGTSAAVYPAAGLLDVAKAAGARVVEINVAATQASNRVDLSWRASAAEALPKLLV